MLVPLVLTIIVVFTSWKFADVWLDHLGGLKWFWLKKSGTTTHNISKVAFTAAIISSISTGFEEFRTWASIAALVFLAVHTSTLLFISERQK